MRFCLSLLALVVSGMLFGQSFPVQATLSVPQASVYPEDLARPGAMVASLTLLDDRSAGGNQQVEVHVDLRISDRQGRVLAVTDPTRLPIVTLRPNAPLILTGNDLRPFIDQLLAEQFVSGGAGPQGQGAGTTAGVVLAEGPLEVCLQAFLPARPGAAVSNRACAIGFADLQPPPSMLQPRGEVTANPADIVSFSWVPNHIGGVVDYELTVWEAPKYGRLPLNLVPSFAAPVNTVTVPGGVTRFTWQTYHGRLTPDNRYVFRVRAVDPTGRLRFENDGYSAPAEFYYLTDPNLPTASDCYQPSDLSFNSITADLHRIEWTGNDIKGAPHRITLRRPNGVFVYQTVRNNTPSDLPRTPLDRNTVRYGLDLDEDLQPGRDGFVLQVCVDCPKTGERNCDRLTIPGTGLPGDGPGGLPDDGVGPVGDDVVDTGDPGGPGDGPVGEPGDNGVIAGDDGGNNDNDDNDGNSATAGNCPDPGAIYAGVTVTGVAPDGIRVDWRGAVADSDPANWLVRFDDKEPFDSLYLQPGDYLRSGLITDDTYTVSVCYYCEADSSYQCETFLTRVPGCGETELTLSVEDVMFDEVSLNWTPIGADSAYLRYAEADSPLLDEPMAVGGSGHTLSGLQPLTTYTVEVCTQCGGQDDGDAIDYNKSAADGLFCDTVTITTTNVSCRLAGEFDYAYTCGEDGPLDPFADEESIDHLSPGDSLWAGDFLIEVASVDGPYASAGSERAEFDGYGYTKVPLLNDARLKVEFYGVQLNRNCRMIGGEMVMVSPIGEVLSQLQQALDQLQDLLADVDNFLANLSNTLGTVSVLLNELATAADINDEALAVLDQVVLNVASVPYMPQSIVDELEDAVDCLRQAAGSGDDAAVEACRNQLQAALDAAQDFIDALYDAPFTVDFNPEGANVYGVDRQPHPLVTEDYPQRTIGGEAYLVPWISTSTETGGTGLRGERRGGGALPGDLAMIGSNEEPLVGWSVNGSAVTNPAVSAGGDQQYKILFASVPRPNAGDSLPPVSIAGQANVVTYAPVRNKVVVVPVNGATVPVTAQQLREGLDRIYRPAVASWEVEVAGNLTVDAFDGELSDIPNSLLSNYTGEMRTLRTAVKGLAGYDSEAYYLIVVPRMEEDNRLGYMPRKRRFGFLTAERLGTPPLFIRTAAHEVAHGVYHLQHVWDRFAGLSPGDTEGLLDQGSGEVLFKYQWDNVHSPENNFTLFDEEGEGESNDELACDAEPPSLDDLTREGMVTITTGSARYSPDMMIRLPSCETEWVGHLGVDYDRDGIRLKTDKQWIRKSRYRFLRPINFFEERADLLMNPFDDGKLDADAQRYYDYFIDSRVIDDEFWKHIFTRAGFAEAFPAVLPYLMHLWLARGDRSPFFETWFNKDSDFSNYGSFRSYYGTDLFQRLLQSRTQPEQQVKYGSVFEVNSNVTTGNDGLMLLGGFVFGTGPEMYLFPEGHPTCLEILEDTSIPGMWKDGIVEAGIEAYRAAVASDGFDAQTNQGWFVYRYSMEDHKIDLADDIALFLTEYHKIRTLLGSCTVVIGGSSRGEEYVNVHVFNSTNAYSGDLIKEIQNRLPVDLNPNLFVDPDYGARATQRGDASSGRYNDLKIPYSNIGQHYIIGDVRLDYYD